MRYVLAKLLVGENLQEDPIAMLAKYPLMNAYWEDKRAKVELIEVPAYILASMSTGLHTIGSTRGFEDIPHNKKWSVRSGNAFVTTIELTSSLP